MLLNLHELIIKHSMKITGVIHAGGHYGEEYGDYIKAGISPIHFFEPCKDTFQVMRNRLNETDCFLHNVGLGAHHKTVTINKESHNRGQSNSILKPAKHLEYYPDIIFEATEQIEIKTLDSFNIISCNLLAMDVQGFELEVLRGAHETLKHIDYVYTEVNKEELYKGCAMVEEIDGYLQGFERVETKWTRQGWGDAIYISKKLL